MKLQKVTVFVLAGLFVALTACSNKAPKEKTEAVGLNSKLGKKLVSQTYCTDTELNKDTTVVSIKQFQFDADKAVTITARQLQTDGTLKDTAQDVGIWGVLNDQVYITTDKLALLASVAPVVRDSDKEDCLNLTADSTSQKLCPCNF
jgi:hypothetical protein